MAIAALIVAALWYSLFILLRAQTAQSFLAHRESQLRSFSRMPRCSRTSGMSTTTTTTTASLLMQSPAAPSRRRAAATYLQAAKIPISDLKDEIIIIKSNSSDESNCDIDKLTATAAKTKTKYIIVLGIVSILITAIAVANAMLLDLDIQFTNTVDSTTSTSTNIWTQITTNPTIILDALSTINIQKGILYFASFYIMAEILAIPVFPLTASSGFLFGIIPGTLICLLCATTAASISFIIGRTLLREYVVETILASNPKFQSFDRIIQRGGFKLMLLVRLSPIFPFAVSNYLYGASGIGFVPYFLGTVVGFMPGTFAYVYAGRVGKALTIDNNINIINSNSAAASSMSTTTLSSTTEPWYIYVGGMVVVLVLLKIVGDVASGVIESLKDEDYDGDDNFLGGGGNIMR